MRAPAILFLIGILICGVFGSAKAEMDWAVSVYGAAITDGDLDNTVTFRADFEDSYLMVLAVSRKIHSFGNHLELEVEAQAAKHFDAQNHMEFNALGVTRWLTFPWDSAIDTSIATGLGLSFATETPEIEKKNHKDTSQLLAYLMFETAFARPEIPQWSLIVRIHHRSGAFGLFNDVNGASNAVGLGVRYRF